MQIGNVN